MIRKPAVAGSFYQADSSRLQTTLKQFINLNLPKTDAVGIVSPHAGYIYSGAVAGAVFSAINIPENAVILAPNHTGLGELFSLAPHEKWQTPLGEVVINRKLNELIKRHCRMIDEEPEAHKKEHSAEVQLPFLQYLKPDIKISVVVIDDHCLEDLKLFGNGLADAIKSFGKKVLIIASSDMTHYEPHETAKEKDRKAIDKIIALDEAGLYHTVRKEHITMCGYAPAIAMLVAAKSLGATNGKLIKYATSGEISGDYNQVVGYAGIIINGEVS